MSHALWTLHFISCVIRSNPLGCAVAITALSVIIDENLSARAARLGEIFRVNLRNINSPLIKDVRGRGLLNAVVINEAQSVKKRTAWQLCLLMKSRGVLAKPTHQNIIRFAPPLVITESALHKAIAIIKQAIVDFDIVRK
jgi:ornithine--oxo-acid transaminase